MQQPEKTTGTKKLQRDHCMGWLGLHTLPLDSQRLGFLSAHRHLGPNETLLGGPHCAMLSVWQHPWMLCTKDQQHLYLQMSPDNCQMSPGVAVVKLSPFENHGCEKEITDKAEGTGSLYLTIHLLDGGLIFWNYIHPILWAVSRVWFMSAKIVTRFIK